MRTAWAAAMGLSWLLGCQATEPTGSAATAEVERGSVKPVLLLTGELDALSSNDVLVPTVPGFRLKIQWLAEDGATVEEGDKVVEFDNSELVSNLADKEQAVLRAENDLAKQVAQDRVTIADKRFALRQHAVALEKAEIDAAIPQDTLARRSYQEYQLALTKARSAHRQAQSDLKTAEKAAAIDRRIKALILEKAERDYRSTVEALKKLTLRAPMNGVMVVADIPWEGRKLQVGDSVWPGLKIVRFPDLRVMQVEAALSDVDDGHVSAGTEVKCWLDAYPEVTLTGKVMSVSPVASEMDGSQLRRAFDVLIALDRDLEVEDGIMRPGMSVRVAVPQPGSQAVLRVVRHAIRDIAGEPRVAVVGRGEVPVELGVCDAHHCEVKSGLSTGERVEVRR